MRLKNNNSGADTEIKLKNNNSGADTEMKLTSTEVQSCQRSSLLNLG